MGMLLNFIVGVLMIIIIVLAVVFYFKYYKTPNKDILRRDINKQTTRSEINQRIKDLNDYQLELALELSELYGYIDKYLDLMKNTSGTETAVLSSKITRLTSRSIEIDAIMNDINSYLDYLNSL